MDATVTPESLVAALRRLDASSRLVLDLSLRREIPDEELAARLDMTVSEVAQRRAEAIARITSTFGIERIDELVELLGAVAELPAREWAAAEEEGAARVQRVRRSGASLMPRVGRVGIAVLPALLAALLTSLLLASGLVGGSAHQEREPVRGASLSASDGTPRVNETRPGQMPPTLGYAPIKRAYGASAFGRRSPVVRTRQPGFRAGKRVHRRRSATHHAGGVKLVPQTLSPVALGPDSSQGNQDPGTEAIVATRVARRGPASSVGRPNGGKVARRRGDAPHGPQVSSRKPVGRPTAGRPSPGASGDKGPPGPRPSGTPGRGSPG